MIGSPQAQFGWQYRVHINRLLAFELDGKARLANVVPPAVAIPLDDPQLKIDAALAAQGKALFFAKNCVACHGFGAVASGGAPDLRASAIALNRQAFDQVVRAGALEAKGMPRFAELGDTELNALFHYLRGRARESLAAAAKPNY